MQLYKVIVDMSVPEGVEIWSWMYPGKHEMLDVALEPKVVNLTSEPLPNNAYRFTLWFNNEQEYKDFNTYKITLPLYQERIAYENENGITRTVVSQEYVDIE